MWIGFEGSLVIMNNNYTFFRKKRNLNIAVETGLEGVFVLEKHGQISKLEKVRSI